MPYQTFSKSIHGAGHIEKGMPCEDYGMVYKDEHCMIFATADGHGDSNCPRSSIGSKLICEIATSELKEFSENIKSQSWEYDLFDSLKAETIIRQLITSMFGKWSCAVNEELNDNPLTELELEQAEDYADSYRIGENTEHIYGTTLIAGLMTDNYLLLLQQGDGRCVVFDSNMRVSQPIPWDDRCFANVTTSICDFDAVNSCRYYIANVKDKPIIACFAGSDGVEDSYSSMDKMHVFYRKLMKIACEQNIDAMNEYLEDFLPELSKSGSRDDITISGVLNVDAVKPFLPKMDIENDIVDAEDEISRAEEKLKSMSRKMDFLTNQYDTFNQQSRETLEKYKNICTELERIARDIASFESETSDDSVNSMIQECKDKNILSAASSLIDSIRDKTLSSYSLNWLRVRKQNLEKEKAEIEVIVNEIERKRAEIENEYKPFKERYDSFVKAKEDAEKKKDELIILLKSFA